jgi:hypothetical protein
MLIQFKSKAAADVLMLGDSAQQILRLVGREGQPKGIFEPEDQAHVIELLDAAIAAEELPPEDVGVEDQAPARPAVSLRQRSWPLREMLLQSQRAGVAVVWGV